MPSRLTKALREVKLPDNHNIRSLMHVSSAWIHGLAFIQLAAWITGNSALSFGITGTACVLLLIIPLGIAVRDVFTYYLTLGNPNRQERNLILDGDLSQLIIPELILAYILIVPGVLLEHVRTDRY